MASYWVALTLLPLLLPLLPLLPLLLLLYACTVQRASLPFRMDQAELALADFDCAVSILRTASAGGESDTVDGGTVELAAALHQVSGAYSDQVAGRFLLCCRLSPLWCLLWCACCLTTTCMCAAGAGAREAG